MGVCMCYGSVYIVCGVGILILWSLFLDIKEPVNGSAYKYKYTYGYIMVTSHTICFYTPSMLIGFPYHKK